jgi:hypothetical protein
VQDERPTGRRADALKVSVSTTASFAYLQPGSSTVCPGGWHLAPPSCGPLLLLPGPKSGSAKAGAAVMERAATAIIDASALRRMRTPPLPTLCTALGVEVVHLGIVVVKIANAAICKVRLPKTRKMRAFTRLADA